MNGNNGTIIIIIIILFYFIIILILPPVVKILGLKTKQVGVGLPLQPSWLMHNASVPCRDWRPADAGFDLWR